MTCEADDEALEGGTWTLGASVGRGRRMAGIHSGLGGAGRGVHRLRGGEGVVGREGRSGRALGGTAAPMG